jgi:hypothetical protein
MFPRDRYGAIPFGIFFMLALWSPVVTLLFCVSQAAVLVVGAVTTWRRTRLPFATASMVIGAIAFVAVAWQAGAQ